MIIQRFMYELQMLVYNRLLFLRGLLYFWKKYSCPQFCTYIGNFFRPKTINWNVWRLAFNEFTLNQFKKIDISCSKQFSNTNRFGLDLYKVLSSAKLRVLLFSIDIVSRIMTKIVLALDHFRTIMQSFKNMKAFLKPF